MPNTTLFSIKGTILRANQKAAAGMRVEVFDRDLRTETLLGNAMTDRQGQYLIEYDYKTAKPAERGSADIVVKVFAANDKLPIATSAILFNAPNMAVIDFTLSETQGVGMAEFDTLMAYLRPLLSDLQPSDLEENDKLQDITFLTGETGWEREKIQRFALSHRLERQTKLQAEFWYALLAMPMFSALKGQSLAAISDDVLDLVPSVSLKTVEQQIRNAVAENWIREDFLKGERLKNWLNIYQYLAMDSLEKGVGKASIKEALELSNINADKQKRAFELYFESQQEEKSWIETLAKDPKKTFSESEIKDIKTTFELADLIGANVTMIGTLKKELGNQGDIALLAQKSSKEWEKTIKASKQQWAHLLFVPLSEVIYLAYYIIPSSR